MSDVSTLSERAYRIRRFALRMGEVQGQGYIAQALDIADVLAVTYFHALRYRPEDPEWEGRDRFLLSIGHYAIAHYAVLIEAGVLPEEWLETTPWLPDATAVRSAYLEMILARLANPDRWLPAVAS